MCLRNISQSDDPITFIALFRNVKEIRYVGHA